MSGHISRAASSESAEISDSREYYRRILPFYEKESIARAHLAFWRRLAREAAPRRILEVGAGLGRITSELARVCPAVGLDVSLEMLSRARQSAGKARFVAGDARRVAFGPAFDLIVAPGDPISHMTLLEDRRRALRAIARQLSADGTFVLEGLHRSRRELALPPRRVRHPAGVLWIRESWIPVGRDDLWHARYRYRDERADGSVRTEAAAFLARAWDPSTIRDLFADCGLEVVTLWGGFAREPFRQGAKRLIVMARLALARRSWKPAPTL